MQRLSRLASGAAFVALLGGVVSSLAAGAIPELVRSVPADRAADVALDVGVLRLVFDRDMRTDSYTCWKSERGQFPPVVKDGGQWKDARTFELKLEKLAPDTEYFVQLNAEQRQGFRAVEGDTPLAVTTIRFRTAAAEKARPRQDVYDPQAEEKGDAKPDKTKPRQDVYDPNAESKAGDKPRETARAASPDRGCRLKWRAQEGQASRVVQNGRLGMNITAVSGAETQQQTVEQAWKTTTLSTVLAADDGHPTRLRQRVEAAEIQARDPQTGQMRRQDAPQAGMEAEVRVLPDGHVEVVEVLRGERELVAELAKEARYFTLEPDREVAVGESWKLTGKQLDAFLGAMSAKEGELTMKLVRVERDAALGQDVAHLEGRWQTKMALEMGLMPTAEGTVAASFALGLGQPVRQQFRAKLKMDQVLEANGERVKVTGDGEFELTEERTVLSGSGKDDEAPAPRDSSKPDAGKECKDKADTPAPERARESGAAREATRDAGAAGKAAGRPRTVAFQRVEEPRERAFSLLAPVGWKVEGGVFRVDPVSTGLHAQAIAAKCNMAVKKDEAGTVELHFLPGILYADTSAMPAGNMFPPGTVYNGCPVVYRLTAEDYLTKAVLPQLRPQARDARVTDTKKLPKVAEAYQQRWAAIPLLGARFEFDVALVTVEYVEGGTRFRERLFTVLQYYPREVGLWQNNDTVSFRAPTGEYEGWEPVGHTMLFSAKFNSQWVQGEIRGQAERAGIVIRTQQELQRIEQEIVAHRQKTNSEINNDMYLTLTGQEEYVNPYTKEVEVDSGDWKYRWVNAAGQIVFTDDGDYNPNHDRNPPFNRTDYQRSQVRPRGQ